MAHGVQQATFPRLPRQECSANLDTGIHNEILLRLKANDRLFRKHKSDNETRQDETAGPKTLPDPLQ
ncbi:hypothetical protein N7466_005803 [Penicillium verhagenii]|uniref:uncharacterized protein n=1 Tax=Penicillium verhagenii TaxID=1562060 RepID=UPI0025452863|nr:uncharacterized protein N7466_005803 [Penicillium verhagenii]KAJ5930310.1 hypothetical protein N7466_005803 [Penicillium verhagenii]